MLKTQEQPAMIKQLTKHKIPPQPAGPSLSFEAPSNIKVESTQGRQNPLDQDRSLSQDYEPRDMQRVEYISADIRHNGFGLQKRI